MRRRCAASASSVVPNGHGAAFTLLSEDNEVGDVTEWPPGWERRLPEPGLRV